MKNYRAKNKERIAKLSKIRYNRWIERNKKKNKEYMRKYMRKYRQELEKYHPNYMKNYKRKYRIDNREKIAKYKKQYCKNNPEKIKEYMKQWTRKKYKTDLKFNLNQKISRAISHSLKGNKNGRHWENLVGYNCDDLIKRLKRTMPEGYTWQDYLNGKLHIDHIIPIAIFNFDSVENPDFKRCWGLKNLRLLPARENLKKGSKLFKPFQPALKLSL